MEQFAVDLSSLGSGPALTRLVDNNMDTGALRPWAEVDRYNRRTGRSFITVQKRHPDGTAVVQAVVDRNTGRPVVNNMGQPVYSPVYTNKLVINAPTTLRREDWLRIDSAVAWAAKNRLRAWSEIYGSNPLNIANGMGTPLLQHAVAVGAATATTSMDGIRKGERSRPTVDTALTPLPITHSDGCFSIREIAVSRNGNLPLDTTNATLAGRAIGELIEQYAVGTSTFAYGGGNIYGLTNHPSRSTKTLTAPTSSNQSTTITEVLDMLNTLRTNFYFGPYVAFYSNNWDQYFDADYSTAYPGVTLRSRLASIPSIQRWQQLDYLGTSKYVIVIAQMTPDVIQGINGMDLNTVQWEEPGGFEWAFKVLCIYVPRVRSDGNAKVGIIHGSN